MRLSDVPGHDRIKKYFERIVAENKVPHALLFTGPKGSGKLPLAIGLAQLLMCENKSAAEACGTCRSCQKIIKLIHPDVHFAFPVMTISGKKRAEVTSMDYLQSWRQFYNNSPFGDLEKWTHHLEGGDKNFNINVKECNQIIRNLSLQTYEGKYKVQIIWAAELLGKEGNRLLKLIEEPSDNTIIILIADNQQYLLNTILSRCQIVQVPPISDEALINHLQSISNLNPETLTEIAYLVSGNMGQALDLMKEDSLQFSDELLEWLRMAHSGQMEKILSWLDPMVKKGKSMQRAFLAYGLHFFREYIRSIHLNGMDIIRLKPDEKNTVLKMHRIIDVNMAEQLINIFNESINKLARNVNVRLMFIHQSYKIEAILKSK